MTIVRAAVGADVAYGRAVAPVVVFDVDAGHAVGCRGGAAESVFKFRRYDASVAVVLADYGCGTVVFVVKWRAHGHQTALVIDVGRADGIVVIVVFRDSPAIAPFVDDGSAGCVARLGAHAVAAAVEGVHLHGHSVAVGLLDTTGVHVLDDGVVAAEVLGNHHQRAVGIAAGGIGPHLSGATEVVAVVADVAAPARGVGAHGGAGVDVHQVHILVVGALLHDIVARCVGYDVVDAGRAESLGPVGRCLAVGVVAELDQVWIEDAADMVAISVDSLYAEPLALGAAAGEPHARAAVAGIFG